ncbi:MAG: hypothetical protein A4E38_01509 [Methanoregulaceae archaeon PtaB.Bin108]|nr:MAG: hypothetical protein A4E38_01509 [Methanoregulaceae archaeon PtaB.Bin108]
MQVIFIPKSGVALYETLLASETSREALRFYQPVQTPLGVRISMATMGGALSLASDLRWYVRRYMYDVLFELPEGIYCTKALAQEIYYGRASILHTRWKFRRTYTMKDGQLLSDDPLPLIRGKPVPGPSREKSGEVILEVWCTEEESLGQKMSDEESGEEVD